MKRIMRYADKIDHLTDLDVQLFCDKELGNDAMLRAVKHLEQCAGCKKRIDEAQILSQLIYEACKKDLKSERQDDCLSDMDISAYIENKVSEGERMRIEEHFNQCGYCLDIVALDGGIFEEAIGEKRLQV